jgi:hypothetical protein
LLFVIRPFAAKSAWFLRFPGIRALDQGAVPGYGEEPLCPSWGRASYKSIRRTYASL